MQPRKDYDDYCRFVNDTYSEEMAAFMKSRQTDEEKDSKFGGSIPPLKSTNNFGSRNASISGSNFHKAKHGRTQSYASNSERSPLMGGTTSDFNKGARANDMLDEKTREQFFNMSDGFRKIFPSDPSDRKMVIPISGYGGHRRGDRSQNFFGKSFRETSLQSKKL